MEYIYLTIAFVFTIIIVAIIIFLLYKPNTNKNNFTLQFKTSNPNVINNGKYLSFNGINFVFENSPNTIFTLYGNYLGISGNKCIVTDSLGTFYTLVDASNIIEQNGSININGIQYYYLSMNINTTQSIANIYYNISGRYQSLSMVTSNGQFMWTDNTNINAEKNMLLPLSLTIMNV